MLSLHVRRWCTILAVLVGVGGAIPCCLAQGAAAAPGPGPAYWLVGGDGGVFQFGRGAYAGSLASHATNSPVVGAATTPNGLGYWLASADGGVFSFGSAPFLGAITGRSRSPIVAIAAAPDGLGYWLAAADGGVFSFGSARYFGAMAGRAHAPIAAMAATADGHGYWMVGTDGAVYSFGTAPYAGGMAGRPLAAPIVAIARDATAGYWLAGSDGGVYAFGGAPWLGGAAGAQHARIVGMAPLPNGVGYWLAAADGGVFSFGNARYFGGVGSSRLNQRIVAIASGDGTAIPRLPGAPFTTEGFDISWPQCGGVHPAPPYGFGVVGVTGGHLFSANSCLAEQWGWARTYGSFAAVYVNTNTPSAVEYLAFALGQARSCGVNVGCVLDLWGRRGVDQALRDAGGIDAPMWWLDVETGNEWLPDTAANAVILRAMIDQLQRAGRKVGIYSTAYQWNKIAGGYAPGLPTWVPGAPPENPDSYCRDHSFGGGPTWMSQSGDPNFDTDHLCTAGLAAYAQAFAPPTPLEVPSYSDPLPPPAPTPVVTVKPRPQVRTSPSAAPTVAPVVLAGPRSLPVHHGHSGWSMWAVVLLGLVVEVAVIVRVLGRHVTPAP